MKDSLKTSQTYKLRLHSTNTSKRSNLGVVVDGTKQINQVLKKKRKKFRGVKILLFI